MKLTKEQIKKMLPGQVLTIPCENAAELDSVYQTALQGRSEANGIVLCISRSNKTQTVTIRATEVVE